MVRLFFSKAKDFVQFLAIVLTKRKKKKKENNGLGYRAPGAKYDLSKTMHCS